MTTFNMNKPEIEQAAIEFKMALINWKSREAEFFKVVVTIKLN
ncbi:hypothetical protein [Psychrobacter faecalis]|nr:hypothetical protein [Psychrobacter faecalis]